LRAQELERQAALVHDRCCVLAVALDGLEPLAVGEQGELAILRVAALAT
jgi:hypothetical protein